MNANSLVAGALACVCLSTVARAENDPQKVYAMPMMRQPNVAAWPAPHPRPQSPLASPHSFESSPSSILEQKLAERDRLQREIDDLRRTTQTVEQVQVKVQMLEVNRTKMRELEVGVAAPADPAGTVDPLAVLKERVSGRGIGAQLLSTVPEKEAGKFVQSLRDNNYAKVLAEPTIVTTSGADASFHVGGEIPLAKGAPSNNIATQKYGTELRVKADALGDDRVRLQVHPRVSEVDSSRSMQVAGHQVPAFKVRECNFTAELEFGESAVVSGLVEERTETRLRDSRLMEQAVEVALLIVVTPERVK